MNAASSATDNQSQMSYVDFSNRSSQTNSCLATCRKICDVIMEPGGKAKYQCLGFFAIIPAIITVGCAFKCGPNLDCNEEVRTTAVVCSGIVAAAIVLLWLCGMRDLCSPCCPTLCCAQRTYKRIEP